MKIIDSCTTTGIARPGMTVREVFEICVRDNVPAIPYCNTEGDADGWISLRHIMIHGCIPDYMIELAHLLGNNLESLNPSEERIDALLRQPIEPLVKRPLLRLTPDAPIIKAIAIMEKYKTNYVFVFDGNDYRGIVTTRKLAQSIMDTNPAQPPTQSAPEHS